MNETIFITTLFIHFGTILHPYSNSVILVKRSEIEFNCGNWIHAKTENRSPQEIKELQGFAM